MRKIILILTILFCTNTCAVAQSQPDSTISKLTQITTDLISSNYNGSINWAAKIGPGNGCPDNVSGPGKGGGGFWHWFVNLIHSIFGGSGDGDDEEGGDGVGSSGGGDGSSSGPIGPPAGPSHGAGITGEGPSGSTGSTGGGGGSSSTPIIIIPPTNPIPADDNDLKNDCVGSTTFKKTFIEPSDSCPSGKSINQYKITTDCFGNTTSNLISSECYQCDNYPVGYGYDNSAILNWVENSYITNTSNALITMPSINEIVKWHNTASFHLTPRQIAFVDTLRKRGATEISINDINKITQPTDTLTQYVNYDDYSVQVDTLPTIASKKQSAPQLLEYIRLNFLKFQDTTYQKIIPYDTANNTVWSNTNKFKSSGTGVVLKIKRTSGINGIAIATNIRNTDSLNKKFILTNVADPNLNGKRQFNTNREFGFKQNPNFTYTFYCRTVDRTSKQSNLFKKILNDTLIETDRGVGQYFSKSVANFINQNGGAAIENDVDFITTDEQSVKDVLLGVDNLCNLTHSMDTTKKPCPTDANFTVTRDMLDKLGDRKTFKNPTDSMKYKRNLDSLPKYINLLAKDFGITNRNALACFLAIAAQETDNFTNLVEDTSFSASNIQGLWGKSLFPDTIVNKYANCKCALDRAYAGNCNARENNNCDEASKDGSTFRGRGLFHLTHRDSYWRFARFYQPKYNDYYINFEHKPYLLETNYKFAVMSAMWEMCIDKSLKPNGTDKPLADNALQQALLGNLDGVINQINLGDTNRRGKKRKLNIIKKILCL
jgi:predicted chitinase